MRPQDSIHDRAQLELLRAHARSALEAAGALGRLPTPVAEVMDAARLIVAEDDLDDSLVAHLRRKTVRARAVLKRALGKIWGVLDAKARLVYVDKAVLGVKQRFLKLHEAAHALLPWQRDIYSVIEDSEGTLAPEVSEQFDQEANTFASEVMFQLDAFALEATAHPFGIRVPLNLSKRYGASVYASVRRYVSSHPRPCAVLVLEPPIYGRGDGFVACLRRVVASPAFARMFGTLEWPEAFAPTDMIGRLVPIGGRKMSRPRELPLTDRNGTIHDCVAEGFTTTHHVFVLIHVRAALTACSIVMP